MLVCPPEEQAWERANVARMFSRIRRLCVLSIACVLALTALPAFAEFSEGAAPPPFVGPGPTGPGLYVGIKDRDGVSVSWVRVSGVNDRGNIVPYMRATWGGGVLELPLVDIYEAEFTYSEGQIQADVRLQSGESLRVSLTNPNDELQGYWRDNKYRIPMSEIRQAWFRYIATAHQPLERYSGPQVRLTAQGVVRSIELQGNGGILMIATTAGEILELHFNYRRLRYGKDLLSQKASYMVGRPVSVIYSLSSSPEGLASRSIDEIQLRYSR